MWQLVAPFIPVDENTLVAQSLHDAAIVIPNTEVRPVLIARWHEQPIATVGPVRDGLRNSRDSLPPEVPKRNIENAMILLFSFSTLGPGLSYNSWERWKTTSSLT